MASLRETRERINSVRSTLKITSAMKLVASAKLRKAQRAIESLRPYERALAEILAALPAAGAPSRSALCSHPGLLHSHPGLDPGSHTQAPKDAGSQSGMTIGAQSGMTRATAVVAIASNSSLCGGFNANVLKKAVETIRGCEDEVEVYPIGRKMADGLRRAGYTAEGDWNDLIGHAAYEKSAELARSLSERFLAGEIVRVLLVYTRFKSASSQEPVVETWLPYEIPGQARDDDKVARDDNKVARDDNQLSSRAKSRDLPANDDVKYILEPDAETLIAQLLPQVLMLKFHAAILDSAAAEQAARTIAMQTATDNAEDLLGELTLEYNKGRQQKITAEILDLLGGSQ